jgi:uncharacterized membrane protein
MKYTKLYAVTFLALIAMAGCVHESLSPVDPSGGTTDPPPATTENCDPDEVYFNQVQDILLSNCAKSGCHDQSTAEKDVILNSYANVMASDVVEAGNPAESDLYERITDTDPDDVMPPLSEPQLTTEQIVLVKDWIAQGARNIVCNEVVCETTNVTFTGHIQPLIDQKCVNCHSGNTPSGGVNLSTHEGVETVALNGRLMGAVTHATGFTAMPFGGQKLADCQIEMIRTWINNGAIKE